MKQSCCQRILLQQQLLSVTERPVVSFVPSVPTVQSVLAVPAVPAVPSVPSLPREVTLAL